MILAIDPGPTQSALIGYDPALRRIDIKAISTNDEVITWITNDARLKNKRCAIEMVACYGMPVGAEVFQTCLWIGRFSQAWITSHAGSAPALIYRKDIKMHFCQSMKAKDSNIRQALIDRFGDPGTKQQPGRLYGIKKDIWAALACAVYYADHSGKE
jgi:hypothetical protein